MGVPSRTSAPTPALDQTYLDSQIILGKVRPFASPGRGQSTGSDHCSWRGCSRRYRDECASLLAPWPTWLGAPNRRGERPLAGDPAWPYHSGQAKLSGAGGARTRDQRIMSPFLAGHLPGKTLSWFVPNRLLWAVFGRCRYRHGTGQVLLYISLGRR